MFFQVIKRENSFPHRQFREVDGIVILSDSSDDDLQKVDSIDNFL